jgi:hypothetical protein
MMNRALWVVLASLAWAQAAWAGGDDLQNCMWKSGAVMDVRTCNSLRRLAERDAAAAAESDKRSAASNARYEKAQALRREKQEAQRLEQEAQAAKWREEADARKAEADRQREREEQIEARSAKAAAAKETQRKQACGDDYRNIRVGMPIERAKACVANLRLTGQINRTDGVVSTYQAGRLYAHVINGKIVSWGQ